MKIHRFQGSCSNGDFQLLLSKDTPGRLQFDKLVGIGCQFVVMFTKPGYNFRYNPSFVIIQDVFKVKPLDQVLPIRVFSDVGRKISQPSNYECYIIPIKLIAVNVKALKISYELLSIPPSQIIFLCQ